MFTFLLNAMLYNQKMSSQGLIIMMNTNKALFSYIAVVHVDIRHNTF